MYTVMRAGSGFQPKHDVFGMVVFVRTLAAARERCDVGEKIVRWSKCGHASKIWRRFDDGKVRVIG